MRILSADYNTAPPGRRERGSVARWRMAFFGAYFSNLCQFGSSGGGAGLKPKVFSNRLA